MNKYYQVLTFANFVLALNFANVASSETDNSTVHFFILAVPDNEIESLRMRAGAFRQEEAGEGGANVITNIAEAAGSAAGVGQILQGVLGGDLRPIFAGTASLIPESDFRDGVNQVLQLAVAPALERIFNEFNKTLLTVLNITTTPSPILLNPNNLNSQPLNNFNNNNQFLQQQLQSGQFNKFQQGGQPGLYPNNIPINQQNQFYQQQVNRFNNLQQQNFNQQNQQNFQNYRPNFSPQQQQSLLSNYNQLQQIIQNHQPNFNQFQSNNQQNFNKFHNQQQHFQQETYDEKFNRLQQQQFFNKNNHNLGHSNYKPADDINNNNQFVHNPEALFTDFYKSFR